MKQLKMDRPLCLLYSLAMILDESPNDLIVELGHDGMEIWWPTYTDHRRFRGHSMQEMIDVCLRRGFALTPIEAFPMQAPDGEHPSEAKATFPEYAERFYQHLARKKAILIGNTSRGNGHAWAWSGYSVYDPRGYSCDIQELAIREAWIMQSIHCAP